MLERAVSVWRRLGGGDDHPADAERADRRVSVRQPAHLETTLRRGNDDKSPAVAARVRDVSPGGIGLVVRQPFEVGDLLCIDLPADAERGRQTALGCVVHVTELDDREWLVGCNWSGELTDEALQAFGIRSAPTDAADKRAS